MFSLAIFFGSVLFELESIQERIEQAYEFNDESLLDSCVKDVQNVILNSSGNPSVQSKAYMVLGDAFYYKQNFLQAYENYKKAIEISGKDDEIYPQALYSMIYSRYNSAMQSTGKQREGYLSQAYEMAEELSIYNVYQQDSYLLKGMIMRHTGDYLGAVANLDKITSEELKGTSYYFKGLILFEQKNYPSSILAFRKAQEFGEDRNLIAASIYQVVIAQMNLKNYREALINSENLITEYSDTRYKDQFFSLHVELLYRTGNYQNAGKYIELVLENAGSVKQQMEAYNAMAWLAYKSGDQRSAVDNWTRGMEIGYSDYSSDAFEMAKNAINALRQQGDSAILISFLNKVKTTFPNKSNDMDLESAKVYISLNDFEEAQVLLNKVIASGMLYQEANYWTAKLYKEKGDFNKSLEYIERVIQSGSQQYLFLGYKFKGDLYYQKGEYQKAVDAYTTSIKYASENEKAQIILNLGIMALDMKDYATAQAQFMKVKTEYASEIDYSLDSAFYLAQTYMARGYYDQAIKEFDWIIKKDNTGKYVNDAILKKIETKIESSNDYDSIIYEINNTISETFDELLKKELAYLKAEVYLKKGDVYSAFENVKNLSEIGLMDSTIGGILYIKGRYYAYQNNEVEMKKNYEKLISEYPLSPKTPWALQDFALYYYNGNSFNESKNLFFKLLSSYPDFSKADAAYFYIGLCYEKLGEKDKALKIYREFLTKFPNSSRIKEVENKIQFLQ